MMPDYTLGDTLDFKFSTRAFATGVPTTLAGTPAISAYVDNSVTQITAGITLTVDFDSVTGLHNIRVVATSGNGYASGSSYALVITTGTVGGVSVVGEVVASFSLGRSAAAADLANGTDGLGAIKAVVDAGATAADIAALNDISAADVWAAATRTLTANTNLNDPTAAAIATAIFTTAMTEAYSTKNGQLTLAQGIYEIASLLQEKAAAGTTLTGYKRDGVTAAFTFTADDAAAPTSLTRAT